jgi:hypothetical protein
VISTPERRPRKPKEEDVATESSEDGADVTEAPEGAGDEEAIEAEADTGEAEAEVEVEVEVEAEAEVEVEAEAEAEAEVEIEAEAEVEVEAEVEGDTGDAEETPVKG